MNNMQNLPLVSVCIPNYNYGQYLDYCLESVYNQTYPNIEVSFRDNCSTDDSYEIALRWRKKFKQKGIYFSVCDNKRNLGSDKNSKLATRDVEGAFVYTLASDDAINPVFLERCVEVFVHNPNVGTVITHREEIDEKGVIHQTPPFYNTDCVIDGESQAAVYMMAGIAIPGQRMVRRSVLDIVEKYFRQFQVAGDWYDNFLYSLVGDVAYITEPLCQYRVHTGNETNESELKLLGTTEHYQLINAFYNLAKSFDYQKPVARYDEAVQKLGSMCLRYALKMYQNKRNDVAYRYLLLAPVYKQDILAEGEYIRLMEMKDLQGRELEEAVAEFAEEYNLQRVKSYDPPDGFQRMDKHGNII
jgi:glycosyltransferase involved in cell wall biosynthesis